MNEFLETTRDVVGLLWMIDIAVLIAASLWVGRRDPVDPAVYLSWQVTVGMWSTVLWLVFAALDFVMDLLLHDWLSAGFDVVVVAFLWWLFIGRGQGKKWKKRAKEKVAVIKGRLKIVPISPLPA